VLVIAYAYYEAQGFLFGPSIEVPNARTEVSDQFITIAGKAERIASLSMNGKDVAVTADGAFSEPYLLAPGVNRIVLQAKDKYGRTTSKVLEIVYTPAAASTMSATSTTNGSSTPTVAP